MADYVLSCCSTVDLTREYLERRDIAYVCYNYELAGVPCKDDFGETHSPAELYALMLSGAEAKTSQISTGDYCEHFERFLSAGKDVLHVTLSSGISQTFNSAMNARDLLAEKYPDRKVVVVDSLCASAGFGLFMDGLADLRDQGYSLDRLAAWAEKNRHHLQHWFFSSDLTFFVKGGRISKASGAIGGLLKICPVMTVEPDGSLGVREKIRSKDKAMRRVLEIMLQLAGAGCTEGGSVGAGVDYSGKCFISQSECMKDAEKMAGLIEDAFPSLNGRVQIFDIGATIGCHTGPGTVAVFFWGAERTGA